MEVFLDQQFLSRKQSFFSAKDGIHLSPHGSQFWLLKAEKAWLCFNKIIGRVFFMDLLRSKSEKYAATVVTSWKTRLKKSCGFHQGFRGCLLDRGKTTAVDLWEVLTAKWLGWFHAKMQNTAATCLFFIDHWGPKKNQDKQRDSPKVGTGLSAVATVAFSPKNVGSGSIPLTKEFCLPRFTWLATHNWAFFEKLLRPDFLWKFLHLFNLRWGDGIFHSTWDQNGR